MENILCSVAESTGKLDGSKVKEILKDTGTAAEMVSGASAGGGGNMTFVQYFTDTILKHLEASDR